MWWQVSTQWQEVLYENSGTPKTVTPILFVNLKCIYVDIVGPSKCLINDEPICEWMFTFTKILQIINYTTNYGPIHEWVSVLYIDMCTPYLVPFPLDLKNGKTYWCNFLASIKSFAWRVAQPASWLLYSNTSGKCSHYLFHGFNILLKKPHPPLAIKDTFHLGVLAKVLRCCSEIFPNVQHLNPTVRFALILSTPLL